MKKRFLSVFLALVLCLGLAAPAFAANTGRSLTTNFSNLTIYDVDAGRYTLGDVDADVTVLVIGRVTCGYTNGMLREVLAAFDDLNISNGRVYLLDVDQSEDTVRSYAQQKPAGAHIAWNNNLRTYNSLFWEIVRAVEPGATSATLPSVCVLDRELQPIYYSSHDTHETSALTAALEPYGEAPAPTPTPSDQSSTDKGTDQPDDATAQRIYQAMIALKAQYPEGTPWTNDNSYRWKGGIYSIGYGCAGFAFMLSDAAFGDLPARKLTGFAFSDVRVGDILRINGNTHSVIVLEVHDDHVVIAEGNFNSSVHWGRKLTAAQIRSADYLLTRYPEAIPAVSFTDVPSWCANAVNWAVGKEITNGTGNNRFSPSNLCRHAEILTFLWRAAGKPKSSAALPVDITGRKVDWAADALRWAAEKGLVDGSLDPTAPCTRADAVIYIWKAFGRSAAAASSFTDVPAGADYAAAVNWAVANGITNGTGGGRFSPDKVCNRGEIVTFLHRAYVPSVRLGAN